MLFPGIDVKSAPWKCSLDCTLSILEEKILDCVDFKCFCCTQAILTHKKNKNSTDLNAAHLFWQTLTGGNELELNRSRFFSSILYMCSWSIVCFIRLACLKQHIVVDYESSCICSVSLVSQLFRAVKWIFPYDANERQLSVFEAVMTYRHNVLQMPSLCCNITNDQGGWQVFKAVPEWICSLLVCMCVSLQDEGSVKSKPNVRSAGHPSVMLIHSFSSLSHVHRKAIWTNAHLTLTHGGLLIFVNVVVSASSKQKEKGGENLYGSGFTDIGETKGTLY